MDIERKVFGKSANKLATLLSQYLQKSNMQDHICRRKRNLPKRPCVGSTWMSTKSSIIPCTLFLLTKLIVPTVCTEAVEGCWQSLMLANYDMDTWLDETEFQTFVPLYHEALIVSAASSSIPPQYVDNQCLFDPTFAMTKTPRLNIILDATFKSLACVCGSRNSNANECCAVLREEGLLQQASNVPGGRGGVFLDLSGILLFDQSKSSERSSLSTLTTFCSVISNAIENACSMPMPDIGTTNNPTSFPESLSPTTTPTTSLPTVQTSTPSLKIDATGRPPTTHIVSSVPTSSTIFPTLEPTAKLSIPAPTNLETVGAESDEGVQNDMTNVDTDDEDGVDVLVAVGVAIVIAGILMGCLVAPGVIRRLRENKERRAYRHSSLRSSVSDQSSSKAQNAQQETYSRTISHNVTQPEHGKHRKALRKPSLSTPLAKQHDDYLQEERRREEEEEVSSVSASSSSLSSTSRSSAPLQIEFSRKQSKNRDQEFRSQLSNNVNECGDVWGSVSGTKTKNTKKNMRSNNKIDSNTRSSLSDSM